MANEKKKSLERVRTLFEWKINANQSMDQLISDTLNMDQNNNNYIENLTNIQKNLKRFQIIDEELYQLWKAVPRSRRNQYKGMKKYLNEKSAINDRYNKEKPVLERQVNKFISIFLNCKYKKKVLIF